MKNRLDLEEDKAEHSDVEAKEEHKEKEKEKVKAFLKKRALQFAHKVKPLPSDSKLKKTYTKYNPGEKSEDKSFIDKAIIFMKECHQKTIDAFTPKEKQRREGITRGRELKRLHRTEAEVKKEFRPEPANKTFNKNLLESWRKSKAGKTTIQKKGARAAYDRASRANGEVKLTGEQKQDPEFMAEFEEVFNRLKEKVSQEKSEYIKGYSAGVNYALTHDISQGVPQSHLDSRSTPYKAGFNHAIEVFKQSHPDFDWEFERGRRAGARFLERSKNSRHYQPGVIVPGKAHQSERWNQGYQFGIQEFWHEKIASGKINTAFGRGWRAGYSKGLLAIATPTEAEIRKRYPDETSDSFFQAYIQACEFRLTTRKRNPDAVRAYIYGSRRAKSIKPPPSEAELKLMGDTVGAEYDRGYRNTIKRNLQLGRDPRLEHAKSLAYSMVNRGAPCPEEKNFIDREPKGTYASSLVENYRLILKQMEAKGFTLKILHARTLGRNGGYYDALREKPRRTPPKKLKKGSATWHWWARYEESFDRVSEKVAAIKELGFVQALDFNLETESQDLEENVFMDVLQILAEKLTQEGLLPLDMDNEAAIEASEIAAEDNSYKALSLVVDACAKELAKEAELKDSPMETVHDKEKGSPDKKEGPEKEIKLRSGKDEKDESSAAMQIEPEEPQLSLAPAPAPAPTPTPRTEKAAEAMPVAAVQPVLPKVAIVATTTPASAKPRAAAAATVVPPIVHNGGSSSVEEKIPVNPAQGSARSAVSYRKIPKKKNLPKNPKPLVQNTARTSQPTPTITPGMVVAPVTAVRQEPPLNAERSSLVSRPLASTSHSHSSSHEDTRARERQREEEKAMQPPAAAPAPLLRVAHEYGQERNRDERDGYRYRERSPERYRDRERSRDRDRLRGRSRERDRTRDYFIDRTPARDKDGFEYRNRSPEQSRGRDSGRDRDQARDGYQSRDREHDTDRDWRHARSRERDRIREPDREQKSHSGSSLGLFAPPRPASTTDQRRVDDRSERRSREELPPRNEYSASRQSWQDRGDKRQRLDSYSDVSDAANTLRTSGFHSRTQRSEAPHSSSREDRQEKKTNSRY